VGAEGRSRQSATVSAQGAIGSLLAVNLVPLAGVLFLGWSTLDTIGSRTPSWACSRCSAG